MTGPRGATLVELLVGTLAAGLLLGAAAALLTVGRRAAWTLASRSSVAASADAAAAVLRAELTAIAAPLGDLVAVDESSVTLRAPRAAGTVCATTPAGAPELVLHGGRLRGWRALDPLRDSVHLWRDGSPFTRADDRWTLAAVAGIGARACPDGEPGLALRLSAPTAELEGVRPGAPVRAWEVVQYRLYADGAGARWFGVRTPSPAGGWSASSPIAGPLQSGGLALRLQAPDGRTVGAPESAATVSVRVRTRSAGRVARPDGGPAVLNDSVEAVVRLGVP